MRELYYENPKQHYKELAVKEAIQFNTALIRRGLRVFLINNKLEEELVADISTESRKNIVDSTDLFVVLWKKAYLYFVNKKLADKNEN